MVLFCLLATIGQINLLRIETAWVSTSAAITHESAAVMQRALTSLGQELRDDATKALECSPKAWCRVRLAGPDGRPRWRAECRAVP